MSENNVVNNKKQLFKFIALAAAALCIVVLIFTLQGDATFSSNVYKVTLKYPREWKQDEGYKQRYQGPDGFFHIGAITGEALSIDQVTELEAKHKLKPYGSDPKITVLEIDGQEARLIMPSIDQTLARNQAGLIVKYPKPVKIGDSTYNYFVLWADKTQIRQISETLAFKK